jgi:hypothetical protein
MEINIPQSLKLEHEELHGELARAMKEGGKIGDAAKAVADVLHHHFIKEEEYALDKEQTSYDDLLDALRLSLKGYKIR